MVRCLDISDETEEKLARFCSESTFVLNIKLLEQRKTFDKTRITGAQFIKIRI